MSGKSISNLFAQQDACAAEDEISDWGSLNVHVTLRENGAWKSDLVFATGCRLLDMRFLECESWLQQQFYELLNDSEPDAQKDPYQFMAELYAQAFDNCLFVPEMIRRISFVSQVISETAFQRLCDEEAFCKEFGIPEENTLTIFIIVNGEFKVKLETSLISREKLIANLNPGACSLLAQDTYRYQ